MCPVFKVSSRKVYKQTSKKLSLKSHVKDRHKGGKSSVVFFNSFKIHVIQKKSCETVNFLLSYIVRI